MLFAPLRAGVLDGIVNASPFANLLDAAVDGLICECRKMVVVLRQDITEWLPDGNGYLLMGFRLIKTHIHSAVLIYGNLVGGNLPLIRNSLPCIDTDEEEVTSDFVSRGEVG